VVGYVRGREIDGNEGKRQVQIMRLGTCGPDGLGVTAGRAAAALPAGSLLPRTRGVQARDV
jgi:hypothetical protein